jgi:hydrogenase nickel incorporation protein HypA/HybF
MHEYSIMCYLLEAVEKQARKMDAKRVLAIHLQVGERAGIDDSLAFYFEQMTPGTIVDGAKLDIRRTAMSFRCKPCAQEYAPLASRGDFSCPGCGEIGQLVSDGSELLIESIEIET